jgi:hypothetical protein
MFLLPIFHITTTVIIVFIDEGIYGDFNEISMIFLFGLSKYDIVMMNTIHEVFK